MKNIVSFLVGFIFAIGLAVSGMLQVQNIKGFLDILGDWNYALIGVMFSAIFIHSIFYFFIKNRTSPLLDTKFHLPTKKNIDFKLLLGSAIFGLGWGWAGICPGPSIVALMSAQKPFLFFVAAMLLGMKLYKWLARLLKL